MADLGDCCHCGSRDGVTNIVMLDRRAPVAGTGWGCIVCGLPFDGAIAVICGECVQAVATGKTTPKNVCWGFPGDRARFAYADLPPGEFAHDEAKHEEDER